MRYLIWILLLFAAAVALVSAAHNPGYVVLVYSSYRIELSLTLFVVALLGLFAVLFVLQRLASAVVRLPGRVRDFRAARALSKQRKSRDEALNAFFAGSFGQAEKLAVQAMRDGDDSALLPVVAARSAHEQHAPARRDTYLETLQGRPGEAEMLRLLSEAKFLLDHKDDKAVLALLPALYDKAGKNHAGVLALELKARQLHGDWARVLTLVAQMEKRSLLDSMAAATIRQHAWLERLRAQETAEGVTACLQDMPGEIRQQGSVAVAAVSALIRLGQCEAVKRLLTDALESHWSGELVGLYAECATAGDDILSSIAQAEKWLVQHPDDAGLLRALGRLCLRRQLWGKAQNYLEASLSVAPSREAYTALAQLFQQTQKPDLAAQNYQRAATFQ
jgi:HemY protein